MKGLLLLTCSFFLLACAPRFTQYQPALSAHADQERVALLAERDRLLKEREQLLALKSTLDSMPPSVAPSPKEVAIMNKERAFEELWRFRGDPYSEYGEWDTGASDGLTPKDRVVTAIKGRLLALHPKWPARVKNAVAKHEVFMGMTPEQVKVSLGHPKDINKSVGSWGVHEQWVYPGGYLYFENGKVTSWQD